jgi:hypothetical protein
MRDPIDIDALQALYDAATSGNWEAAKSTSWLLNAYGSYTHGGIAALYIKLGGSARVLGMDFDKVEDARFAATVHNVFPNLLSELVDLRRRTEQAEAQVARLSTYGDHRRGCPVSPCTCGFHAALVPMEESDE